LAKMNYTIKGDPHTYVLFETCLTWSETPKLIPIVDTFIASYRFIDNDGEVFLLLTDKDASNFKIISVNISQGIDKVSLLYPWSHNRPIRGEVYVDKYWFDILTKIRRNVSHTVQAKTVIAEREYSLESAAVVGGGRLVVSYIENVKSALYLYTRDGMQVHQFPLSVGQIGASWEHKNVNEVIVRMYSSSTIGHRCSSHSPPSPHHNWYIVLTWQTRRTTCSWFVAQKSPYRSIHSHRYTLNKCSIRARMARKYPCTYYMIKLSLIEFARLW
jgi:hypothetical protein